jgi:sialate O-acetylesterase
MLSTYSVWGTVRLPSLISDHMVLQRDIQVKVWGWADPGEAVSVEFVEQQVRAVADSNGRWSVALEPLEAGGPHEMKVSGSNILTVRDILVGEVWIGSGQSNMQWTVRDSGNPDEEIANADYPQLRLFSVERTVADKPQEDVVGHWAPTNPESVAGFSAVSYFFGREIHGNLEVPVGMIHSSWGGTPAESWTSQEALQANLSLMPILWNWKRTLLNHPYAEAEYEERLEEWKREEAEARAEGQPIPRQPRAPQGPGHSWTPSGLYNAMIAPLTSFAIRGAIWYQGESNASAYRSYEYRELFRTMIQDWRRAWNQGPFPFLFVQLANFRERKSEPVESTWAELQEAQRLALALPNTGMAVTIDIGEADDIHPKNKQDVGSRLALAARSVAYGQDIAFSGPLYRGMKVEGSQIRVYFDHVGGGLELRNGQATGFAIAGRDRTFRWANVQIDGDTIVVSNPEIPSPIAVRYAWQDNPEASLFNAEGLPASPFRTDDWWSPGVVLP